MKKTLLILSLFALTLGCSSTQVAELEESKIEIQDEKAKALTSMGNNLVKNKLYTQATEKYLEAIEVQPSYYKAHYALGRVLLKRGFNQRGVDSIKKAISIKSNFTEARNFLSNFYYKQGLYEKSLKESLAASKDIIYKDQEATLTQLGLTYSKLNNKREALLNMKRALATQARSCKNRFSISKFFYKKGFVNTALKVARQADSLCTGDKDKNALRFLKALIFYKSENYLASKQILNGFSPNQNHIKKAIPKLLTKINKKTGL